MEIEVLAGSNQLLPGQLSALMEKVVIRPEIRSEFFEERRIRFRSDSMRPQHGRPLSASFRGHLKSIQNASRFVLLEIRRRSSTFRIIAGRRCHQPKLRVIKNGNHHSAKSDFIFRQPVNAVFVRNDLRYYTVPHVLRDEGTYPFDAVTDFELGHLALVKGNKRAMMPRKM